ncbi:hypothetical protein N7520_009138 [Penicillium odoratum]|uniref:uncharacterized protein n=1 Tax=Penicillium odoratum TaxID=1167516 RepID=UPI002547752A|nr:uncharacterized protein N7520_009138 [Penicillium odoratum]KAJ5752221.1 hypothetical protein N7520_009138 [Penicillium odoratum]
MLQTEENWNQCLQTLEGHLATVRSVAWSQDNTRMASGSDDYTVRIRDSTTGQCVLKLEGHTYLFPDQSTTGLHQDLMMGRLESGT